MSGIQPLADKVVVRRVEAIEQSEGGLYIPTTAQEKPTEGVVVSVGSGRYTDTGFLVPMELSEGDRVIFGKYNGTEVKVDGEDLVIMREQDVLAVLLK